MKTKRTFMTMTKPIPILVCITVFLLNQMLYSQERPNRSNYPPSNTLPPIWGEEGEYMTNSNTLGHESPDGLSFFVRSKERLRITGGAANHGRNGRISLMGPQDHEALIIEGGSGNILSGRNDGIFRGALNIISSSLPTEDFPDDNSYTTWFVKNLINLEAYGDHDRAGITFSRRSTKRREWTIYRHYNLNTESTDLIFGTGLDHNNSIYEYETDDRMVLSANGDITINSGGTDHLVQVSINTDAKVDHAALTVAGALYVGPQAEKASTGDLDKFNQEYIDDYNLWVEDGIVTEDIVLVQVDSWSDHVLKEDYELPKLSEVENFIKENGHLKNIPSEAKVLEAGYKQHNINKGLLEKVEELTLYIIAQEKRIVQLEKQLNAKTK